MPLILWLTVKNQKKNKQKPNPIPPKELQFHEDEVSKIIKRFFLIIFPSVPKVLKDILQDSNLRSEKATSIPLQ